MATCVPRAQDLAFPLEELDPIQHGLMHIDEDVELIGIGGPGICGDKGVARNVGTLVRLDKTLLQDPIPGSIVGPVNHTLHLGWGLHWHHSVLLEDAKLTHKNTRTCHENNINTIISSSV